MRFAARLGVLGLAFIAMFSVIGLRLWFVQVAEGPSIALAAEEQTWLEKRTEAPRGNIYDRNGDLLATSRMVPAVWIDRTFVQPDERDGLIQKLSAMLAIEPVDLDAMYEEAGINGRFQVATVSTELAYQITESFDELPGVEIIKVPERVYLSGPTLAHVIGHLGKPSADDLEARPELDPNLRIGQLGVEDAYDDYLRGEPGSIEYRVRRGEIIDQRPPTEPTLGDSIELTIDLELQQLVELALEDGIALSNEEKEKKRRTGEEVFSDTTRAAAVVLDVRSFEVLAIASVPDFHPFASIDTVTFQALNDSGAFNNLAVSGVFPPASTFKGITYTVFEEEDIPFPTDIEGVRPNSREVNCDGELVLPDLADGSAQVKHDWYWGSSVRSSYGWQDIHGALTISCNIFFWNVGLGAWEARDEIGENLLQDWAKDLGYGSPTGIDLTNESSGVVPTRELFEEWAAIQRENPDQVLLHPSRLELGSPFLGGDLMDFAIGQGAFTATPLQVAVSYAALANGGTVREPRVVRRVLASDGTLVERIDSPLVRQVPISEEVHQALLRDLNRVVTSGTAWRAFENFGPDGELAQVGGKTGTAQASRNQDDHAWFVGLAPLDTPRYVVAVVIEQGGSGGLIAAPVARHILQYLMGITPTEIIAGQDAD